MAAKLVLTVSGLCALVHDKVEKKLHILLVDARSNVVENTHSGSRHAAHLVHAPRLVFDASGFDSAPNGDWKVESWVDLGGRTLGSVRLDKDILSFDTLTQGNLQIDTTARRAPSPTSGSGDEKSLLWVPPAKAMNPNLHIRPEAITDLTGVVARLTLDRGTVTVSNFQRDSRTTGNPYTIWEFKDPDTSNVLWKSAIATAVSVELSLASDQDMVIASQGPDGIVKNRLTLGLPQAEPKVVQVGLTNIPEDLTATDHFGLYFDLFDPPLPQAQRPFVTRVVQNPGPGVLLPAGVSSGSLCPLIRDEQP